MPLNAMGFYCFDGKASFTVERENPGSIILLSNKRAPAVVNMLLDECQNADVTILHLA